MVEVAIIFSQEAIIYRISTVVSDPPVSTIAHVCAKSIFAASAILARVGHALIEFHVAMLTRPANDTCTSVGIHHGR